MVDSLNRHSLELVCPPLSHPHMSYERRYRAPLVRLGTLFDGARIQAEVDQFDGIHWSVPFRDTGPSLPLVDYCSGQRTPRFPLTPTPYLGKCPYVQQVLAYLGGALSHAAVKRLPAGASYSPHYDAHPLWRDQLRLHIPVATHPDVTFYCAGMSAHMRSGELWAFDRRAPHAVKNDSPVDRLHLVIDTTGSSSVWTALVGGAEMPRLPNSLHAGEQGIYLCKNDALGAVVHPAEMDLFVAETLDRAREALDASALGEHLLLFSREWRSTWARFGDSREHLSDYEGIVASLLDRLPARASIYEHDRAENEVLLRIVNQLANSIRFVPGERCFVTRNAPLIRVETQGFSSLFHDFSWVPLSGPELSVIRSCPHLERDIESPGTSPESVSAVTSLFERGILVRSHVTYQMSAKLRARLRALLDAFTRSQPPFGFSASDAGSDELPRRCTDLRSGAEIRYPLHVRLHQGRIYVYNEELGYYVEPAVVGTAEAAISSMMCC